MTIKIRVEETDGTHSRFTVERDGVTSSGLMPHDGEGDVLELVGDADILWAATCAYDGLDEGWEMTDEELEEQGGGFWSRPS